MPFLFIAALLADPTPGVQWHVYTSPVFKSCRESESDLRTMLEPLGWKIGPESDANFRTFPIKEQPARTDEVLPTFELVVNGKVIHSIYGYVDAYFFADEFNRCIPGLEPEPTQRNPE